MYALMPVGTIYVIMLESISVISIHHLRMMNPARGRKLWDLLDKVTIAKPFLWIWAHIPKRFEFFALERLGTQE